MKTKNILKSLAFAMLMPTMLFTTSCSNDDELANENTSAKKGYTLPVTVNVTRQGDATTRATYDATTKKLSFSAGDKLFVKGNDDRAGGVGAGYFAGTLEYVDGSEGTFSGTINFVVSSYTGTIDDAFANGAAEATLLPAGYEQKNYIYFNNPDTWYTEILFNYGYAIAGDLATAVEQFSHECGTYTSGTGFALAPQNAIVNFSYKSSSPVDEGDTSTPYLHTYDPTTDYGGWVDVPFGAGNIITFAIAVDGNLGTKKWELQDDDWNIDFTDLGTKNLEAGHIYNWTNVAPVDLSTLTGDYEAKNGDILTGELEHEYQITIAAGATVTLAGVNIDPTYVDHCAGITCLGDATIILKDGTDNYVWGDTDYAGIFVPDGSTLIIDGGGSLETGSTYAAGIGGNRYDDCGNIIIKGGSIVAKGSGGAGIGSGPDMSCGTITITGGNITAQGNNLNGFAAGIGTGNYGDCGDIVISGGTVTATGGKFSAGIGGGCNGYPSNITIYNTVTKVTATKGDNGYCSIGLGDEDADINGKVIIDGVDKGDGVEDSPYVYQP